MSIAAFTNEPGDHSRYESRSTHQRGKYYASENIDEVVSFDAILAEQSFKPFPTNGKVPHKHDTFYYRAVRKIVNDSPGSKRRLVRSGPDNHVDVNLVVDDFISNRYRLGSYVVPNPGYDNGLSESVTEALNSLSENYVGLGNDLGEAHQVIDLFSTSAARLAAGLKAFKSRRFGDFAKIFSGPGKGSVGRINNTADLWLEYSYGWKPLMSDLYELYPHVVNSVYKPLFVRGYGHGTSSNKVAFVYDVLDVHGSVSTSSKTELIGVVTKPWLYELQQIGILNPLSIAWELVPWSFAIDWFVPVGATLQALTSTCGLAFEGGRTTNQTKDSLDIQLITDDTHEGDGYWIESAGDYRDVGFSFNRIPYTDFPSPRLYADTTPYSTPRALNALALAQQLQRA